MIASYTFRARPWTVNGERSAHWSQTREVTREWRRAFWALGLEQRARFDGPVVVEVEVVMRPPMADTGACFGAVKAAIDGLVDARVLTGDTGDIVRSITFHAPTRAEKGIAERVTLTVASV